MHKMLALSINILFSTVVLAQNKSFQYFSGKDIDYWNEGKVVKESFISDINEPATDASKQENTEKNFSGSTAIRGKDNAKFEWKNYRDPKKPEFWDDGGDWIPPRPFREAVSNPTKENIDAYLQWMVLKTALVDRFKVALKNYTAQYQIEQNNKLETISAPINTIKRQQKINDKSFINWSNVQVAYFYQTSCPHCQKSIPVVENLKRSGASIQYIQLDSNKNPPLHENSIPYTKELDEYFHINSTPTWVLKVRNTYTQLVGEQSFETLEKTAKKLLKGEDDQ